MTHKSSTYKSSAAWAGFARRITAEVLLATCITLNFACAVPLRLDNFETLSHRELGLIKGSTGLTEAKNIMKRSKMTGIKTATHIALEGDKIDAITADYQTEIHVFVNDIYDHSISIHGREGPNDKAVRGGMMGYGYALGLATYEDNIFLLTLYRDPLSLTQYSTRSVAPPRIEIFVLENAGFKRIGTRWLGSLEQRSHGMTNPAFIGNDLESGVILVAENRTGQAWRSVPVLRMNQDYRLNTSAMPLEKALECSCVRNHLRIGSATEVY